MFHRHIDLFVMAMPPCCFLLKTLNFYHYFRLQAAVQSTKCFDYLNTVVDTIGHSFLTADLDVRHSATAMLAAHMHNYN